MESPLKKVLKMLDIHNDYVAMKKAEMNHEEYQSKYFCEVVSEVIEIHSMREVEGFVDGC